MHLDNQRPKNLGLADLSTEISNADSKEKITSLIIDFFKSRGFEDVIVDAYWEPYKEDEEKWNLRIEADAIRCRFEFDGKYLQLRMKSSEPTDYYSSLQINTYREKISEAVSSKLKSTSALQFIIGKAVHDLNNAMAISVSELGYMEPRIQDPELKEALSNTRTSQERILGVIEILNSLKNGGGVQKTANNHDKEKNIEIPPKDRKVLVIDDDQSILYMLKRGLSESSTNGEPVPQMEYVNSGEGAINLLQSGFAPDLIICDMDMDGMTGKHVYEWIKQNKPELLPGFHLYTGGLEKQATKEFIEESKVPALNKLPAQEFMKWMINYFSQA